MKQFYVTSLFLLISLTNYCKSSLFESDSCYSFGSGNVFPGGARKIDHKLQFTKAMSEDTIDSTFFDFYIPYKTLPR